MAELSARSAANANFPQAYWVWYQLNPPGLACTESVNFLFLRN